MKKFLSLLLSVSIVSGCMSMAYGNENISESESQISDIAEETDTSAEFYNPKYGEFIEDIKDLPEDERKAKLANAPSKYSYNEEYVSDDEGISAYSTSERASLPSTYNNSLAPQHVSYFQNKGYMDTGWTFAANAVLEANIMNSNGNNIVDLSEEHLRYSTSNDISEEFGYPRSASETGNFNMALSYWTRGTLSGPVFENILPYNMFTYTGAYTMADLNSMNKADYLVSNTVTLSSLSRSADTGTGTRIASIKNMIMDYGGVYVSVPFTEDAFNTTYTAYYNNGSIEEDEDNQVTLVGWDNTYSTSNFGSVKPSSSGAFVAVDSREIGDRGIRCFYLSYDMVSRFGPCSAVSGVESRDKYDNIYEHETRLIEESDSGTFYNLSSTKNAFAEKYTSQNNAAGEVISAVSTYCTVPNSYYKLYISTTGDQADMREVSLKGAGSNGVCVSNMGYHTFELAEPVSITGDTFWVGMEVYNASDNRTIPVCPSYIRGNENTGVYASNIASIKSNTNVSNTGRLILKIHTQNIIPDEMFWNFSEDKFDSLSHITGNTSINGLTFNATSEKDMNIVNSTLRINDTRYDRYLSLNGKGNENYRNLSFDVSGSVDIYVVAKSGNVKETRNLILANSNGLVNVQPVNNVDCYKLTYTGGADTLYLYSQHNGINIYTIGYKRNNVESVQTTDDDNKDWTFDSEELASYSGSDYITNDITTSDGLIIKASEEYPMYMVRTTNRKNGFKYYQAINLAGESRYGKRQIIFDVKKDMDIYITAAHSGGASEIRKLNVRGQFGEDVIDSVDGEDTNIINVTNQIKTYKLTYNGDGGKILLHSLDNAIKLYRISVVYKNKASGENNASLIIDDKFNSTASYYSNQSAGVFTILAAPERYVNIVSAPIEYNSVTYNRALRFYEPNPSHVENRSIKFYVYNSVNNTTYIDCICSGNGKLVLADEYSIIEECSISKTSNVRFAYTGYARNLYLYTTNSNGIYAVNISNNAVSPYLLDDILQEETTEVTSNEALTEEAAEITSGEVLSENYTEIVSEEVTDTENTESTQITENTDVINDKENMNDVADEVTGSQDNLYGTDEEELPNVIMENIHYEEEQITDL
ncbi:MAG: C1 family peptidase [Clostridia bacterium]|nr:C1 family peptidase [Clostridia bacterium]